MKPGAFVMICGERHVGKSALVLCALRESNDRLVYFTCFKTSIKSNVSRFMDALVGSGVWNEKHQFTRFEDFFESLAKLDETLNIVIDEFSYLKAVNYPVTVDSIFRNIAVRCLSNIRLFVICSDVGETAKTRDVETGASGMLDTVIHLNGLAYKEASAFYSPKARVTKPFFIRFSAAPRMSTLALIHRSHRKKTSSRFF
ncbi:MAG: ATP-binding protein [Clostridia bacterium]|nr:ATP-binding protein [Clostridia bacterium]